MLDGVRPGGGVVWAVGTLPGHGVQQLRRCSEGSREVGGSVSGGAEVRAVWSRGWRSEVGGDQALGVLPSQKLAQGVLGDRRPMAALGEPVRCQTQDLSERAPAPQAGTPGLPPSSPTLQGYLEVRACLAYGHGCGASVCSSPL